MAKYNVNGKCIICHNIYDKNHYQKNHQTHGFKKGHTPWFLNISLNKKNEFFNYLLQRRKELKSWNGNKNPNWKGGQCNKSVLLRGSKQYKNWVQTILKRDNYTCQLCNDNTGGNLEVHHIIPIRERFDLAMKENNVITLCHTCHKKTWWKESQFINIFNEEIKCGLTMV